MATRQAAIVPACRFVVAHHQKEIKAMSSNAMLPIYDKAHDKANDYMGKASAYLLLSALALRECVNGGELLRIDGKPFPNAAQFSADDRKALSAAMVARANADSATESKALARFKGNLQRESEIRNDYRNKRNAATRDILPALAMAFFKTLTGRDAIADYDKGKVSIPASWFLPWNAAPSEAQALLGEHDANKRMLSATTTTAKDEIAFFTVEGLASYEKECARASAANAPKPSPFEYSAFLQVGVNATGLQNALDAYRQAQALHVKAEEKKSAAAQALANANAAQAVADKAKSLGADPETIATTSAAAEQAKQALDNAASEALQAQQQASDAVKEPQQRKPGGAVNQQGQSIPIADNVKTISTCCDFLGKAAMGDDCKRSFAPSVMESWQELANAIWRNPNLAHAFLIERDAVQKEQAEEQAQKKSA
jgi:hypothetical protein